MSPSPHTAIIECDSGNEYNGKLGLRISSIFVIGVGSMLGALLPILAAQSKRMRVPPLAFFVAKYFGSGVIIATAFIHLLAPATEALTNPCLTGPITEYSWAEGIALMTVFTMFFIELMASRFDVFGEKHHDLEASDPSKELIRVGGNGDETGATMIAQSHSHTQVDKNDDTIESTPGGGSEDGSGVRPSDQAAQSNIPGRKDDLSYPPGGEDHLGHRREHQLDDDHFAAQMTAIFILEFGVIFHSIFIGLTLAVAGKNFTVLYIVLVFHQTFEGLGLGSRLATADWPRKKQWMPWLLGASYGFSTPISIAVGLGISASFAPDSPLALIVNGVFDSISAGILIYTGLVELMAHEFMFNPEMRKSSIKMMLFAYSCMCVGAGLMALLGKWA